MKRWERASGRPEDGTVELGEVVYLPTPVRVASRSTNLGAPVQPGSAVLHITATTRSVRVELVAVKAVKVKAGNGVGVTLPDRTTVAGVVASISTRATKDDDDAAGGGGTGSGAGAAESKVELNVTVADQARLGSFDEAPVDVRLTRDQVRAVLVAPVGALLALAEGGYAVQVVGADGTSRLVGVETGLFAGTFVEVRSPDLQPGARVVVPA